VRTLLLVCCLAGSSLLAEDPRVTALLVKGDAEERQHHTAAALAAFKEAEGIEPKNVAVLLRIAKQYSDLVEATRPPSAAEQMAHKSLEYAKRAVQLDPNNAKARLSVAIGYGKLTDFVSSKTKIEYSKLIKEATEKSIELDSHDDFAWHVLGRWHYGVANVGAVLKALARVVYGGLPPASNEEAVRCLKKATELAPQRIIHHAALARVYRDIGKTELATRSWQAVIDLPALDGEDEADKKEARKALAK
jgi:tetratricopeptide (TPR) repeat protein